MGVGKLTGLNKDLRFENFPLSSGNDLAYETAKAFIVPASRIGNPLFMCGGSSEERTHLLHAIGNYAREHSRSIIKYVDSEVFMNEAREAKAKGKLAPLLRKYEAYGVFLIDNVQVLARSEAIQEVYFKLFNNLYDRRSRIAMTSDVCVDCMPSLHERLASRFEWGEVIEIH